MPTTRRAVLGALATLPVAGCSGDDGAGTETTRASTTERTSEGTSTTPPMTSTHSGSVRLEPGGTYEGDDVAVTVSDFAVHHGMVTFGTTHPDPVWEDGAQFLLATVTVDGDEDPANLPITARTNTMLDGPTRYYGWAPDTPETVQPFGFVVPTDPAPSSAAIVWDGPREVSWGVPEDLVATLGAAPSFSVEGFGVPDTGGEGEELSVTLEVANDGQRDGRFLAELGNADISDQPEIRIEVPSGSSRTVERSVEAQFFDGDMPVVLRWEGGSERRTVSKK